MVGAAAAPAAAHQSTGNTRCAEPGGGSIGAEDGGADDEEAQTQKRRQMYLSQRSFYGSPGPVQIFETIYHPLGLEDPTEKLIGKFVCISSLFLICFFI